MYSKQAEADLEELRAEGLRPTDADVVRLHELGWRCERGPETTALNAPRRAYAGNCAFYEPTVCAIAWMREHEGRARDGRSADWMWAYALAHARDPEALAAADTPAKIRSAVEGWAAGLDATEAEVMRAADYVCGAGEAVAERTELEIASAAGADPDAELEELLAEAAAAAGLTWREIIAQTPARLVAVVRAAYALRHGEPEHTRSAGRATAAYMATLAAIAKRLRSEAASGGKVELVQDPRQDGGQLDRAEHGEQVGGRPVEVVGESGVE